jgi:Protein of unknown function (DUF2946)
MLFAVRCGASFGMKWFRANIRHGSRLALLALAIQFALSFGHFHAVAAEASPANQYRIALTNLIPDAAPADGVFITKHIIPPAQAKGQPPASGHDSGGQSEDACAICAVMAMANAVLFATPPLLQLPQAVEFLYRTTDAEFVHLDSFRVAFQPRAPPIS